jgi:hypothetical protein
MTSSCFGIIPDVLELFHERSTNGPRALTILSFPVVAPRLATAPASLATAFFWHQATAEPRKLEKLEKLEKKARAKLRSVILNVF